MVNPTESPKERKTCRMQFAVRPSFARELEVYCQIYGLSKTELMERAVSMLLNASSEHTARMLSQAVSNAASEESSNV